MNVLITGSSGFFGTHLVRHFAERGDYRIFTLDRSAPSTAQGIDHSYLIDSSRTELLQGIELPQGIEENHYDMIVHSAAMSSFALCESEPQEAEKANVHYSGQILRLAAEQEAKLVFLSTDLVFDGNQVHDEKPFLEDDQPIPISVYSQTKYAAEQHILSELPTALVLRSSLMFGEPAGNGGGPLQWLLKSLDEDREVQLFFDEWRTPVWTGDLVQIVEQAYQSGLSGVYHCAGDERLSRVEFAESLASACNKRCRSKIVSRDSVPGPPRPADVSLDNSAISSALNFRFTPLQEAFAQSVP